ncbi:hypothetical protein NDA11_001483 [Ustilago hordei]|uniref:SAP domain-containing protein n=1 Tax=Ustilago hordei TaxID=120017 RepID=I2FRZ5_USTHO|nr:uncharacterized protein UHO2_07338 [Ustilago hordei]KAJ1045097.1 hypothetical protein NDA10_000788 [Ustilago hordei]KAJ1572133.1 hypothetical protein NDA15_005562 [Ustilago hordei]KAJ1573441.1 hypothetical protein NDA11_001483 [Ustilago hordei]KAJ1594459.1 hypothetical protein NDA12_004998 [Ustilago hordei]KAJ1598400.1 hypothetical protein NDA14_007407 [Ustilago hordei]
MESKLQSLKVTELKQLLTAAGLAVSGNKPDLIQRLLENPQATASLGGGEGAASSPAQPPAAPAPVSADPTPTPALALAASEPALSTTTTTQNGAVQTFTTSTSPAEPSEEEGRQALIVELEKRKARAAKFGQPLGEAERKLERAIKFGLDPTEEAAVSKLTKPLSNPADKRKEKKERREAVVVEKKPEETEDERKEREKREEEEKEKARRRAERFGLKTSGEGEKRKGEEANGGVEKRVKA